MQLRKKLAFIFIAVSVFFILATKTFAVENLFSVLENLNIGESIAQSILSQGELIEQTASSEKYSFESDWYSTPHIVKTEDGILSYLEVKIPPESIGEYQNLLASLEKPEIELVKTEYLHLKAWPSKGMGFIINEAVENELRFIKFPVVSAEAFIESDGKNFAPIPRTLNATDSAEGPTLLELQAQNNEASASGKGVSALFISPIFIGGLIGILCLLIFIGWMLYRRRPPRPLP